MCIGQTNDFVAFINRFEFIEFPFVVSDEPLKNNENIFQKVFKRDEFLKYLNGIPEQTRKNTYYYYGGQTTYKGFSILIYKLVDFGEEITYDTVRIDLVVFDSEGKMISKMMIGGQETEEKLINCIINRDMTFEVTIEYPWKKLKQKRKYFIDDNGKIKTLSEASFLK